jgi:predicted SAM-dependent methyltransferase
MTWRKDDPQGNESKKIVWEVAPYLRGRGVDLGAGDFKILPHAISVDNMHHAAFGYKIKPDVMVETCEDLSVFGGHSMDFVYSSHLLEHMEDPAKSLKGWWRLVKQGGYMVLYLPHEDLYPKIGEEGANPDHKHNLNEQKVIDWMMEVGSWDLVQCQKRGEDSEYSFLMVFKKL